MFFKKCTFKTQQCLKILLLLYIDIIDFMSPQSNLISDLPSDIAFLLNNTLHTVFDESRFTN